MPDLPPPTGAPLLGVGPVPLRLRPPSSVFDVAPAPAREVGGARLATAALVLGILALLLNVLLVPTLLAVVFGVVALVTRTAARGRAIAGIVLGVVGVLAFCVQAAVLIPLLLGAQRSAVAAELESTIANQAAQQGAPLRSVDCPPPPRVAAGTTLTCGAVSAQGASVPLVVTFTDSRGSFRVRAAAAG